MPKLIEIAQEYASLKGIDVKPVMIAIRQLIDICGDKNIEDYDRADARNFIDKYENVKTTTIRRRELSGLNLMWTNGKLTQTAVMINPEDKIEGNVSEAKRIYVAEDSTAVYFLKKFPSYTSINRTIVSVRESKQSTTYCHPVD